MSLFPEIASLKIGNPIVETIRFKTMKSNFDRFGEEQRKQKWLYHRRDIKITCPYVTKTEAELLFQFYIDRGGSYGAFYFNWPIARETPYSFVKEYVGTGDGSETIFQLPSRYASSYTLYVDGTPTGFTFAGLGGSDGQDKCTLGAAASDGAAITFSFTGYLSSRFIFKDDNLTLEHFYDKLVNSGVELEGVLYDA